MITSYRDEKACRVHVFVIGIIGAIITTGLLIYLCLYLVEYRHNSNTITLQSNSTNSTAKSVKLAAINVNDPEIAKAAATIAKISSISGNTATNDDDDDTTLIKAPVTTLKEAAVPSFTRVTIPSSQLSVTHIAEPPKPIKQITVIPEKIELTDVTPTI
jgi:hypothetical protein